MRVSTTLCILVAVGSVGAHPPTCSELWTYYETCSLDGPITTDTIAEVCTGAVCGPLLEEAKVKCAVDEAEHLQEATDFCEAVTCNSLAQVYTSCTGETKEEFCNADCVRAIAAGDTECPDAANLEWAARRCPGDPCLDATETLVYTCYFTATLTEACTPECRNLIEDVKSKCEVDSQEYEVALDNEQACDNPACGEPYWYVAENCYDDESNDPICGATCTSKLEEMASGCLGLLAFDYYALDFDYCNAIECDESDAESCPSYMQCDCSSSSRRLLFATPPMCSCALP